MLTCLASMPYNSQRIRDVVDDAAELDVATKMVGLRWRLVPCTGNSRHKPRLLRASSANSSLRRLSRRLKHRFSVLQAAGVGRRAWPGEEELQQLMEM